MTNWEPMLPGTLLRGRYEIEALLGRGGFGATYRVCDRACYEELRALKELLPWHTEDPKVRELFEREARTLSELRRAGIPALYAYFLDAGRYYLVQEYVPGKTLGHERRRRDPLSEVEVVQLLEEVLTILHHLHGGRRPVIHRDIKPDNLIRAEDGRLYLIDFGAVKAAMGQGQGQGGRGSTVIGSDFYSPPEQYRGEVFPATDLYALGVTALCLVSSRPLEDWYDRLSGRWRLTGLPVSPRLLAVLERLLENEHGRRFQAASEVLCALGLTSGKTRPEPSGERTTTPRGSESLLIGATLTGRYKITQVLMRGPSATLYRVVDLERLNQPCTMVELVPPVPPEFERETRALAGRSHPGVARILACFVEAGRSYVVQEDVVGYSLAERLRDAGPFAEARVVEVLRAALEALAYLHARSPAIVHRGIEPSSLLVPEGAPLADLVLTGFGVVREVVAGAEPRATETSPSRYAAPEQRQGDIQPASDLYALGVTALELLAGQVPTDTRDAEVALEVLSAEVSAGLRSVLRKMIQPSVGSRYRCARDVLIDLEQLGAASVCVPTTGRSTVLEASVAPPRTPASLVELWTSYRAPITTVIALVAFLGVVALVNSRPQPRTAETAPVAAAPAAAPMPMQVHVTASQKVSDRGVLEVRFAADVTGGTPPFSYQWSFPGGSGYEMIQSNPKLGFGFALRKSNPSETYFSPGAKQIDLTVGDGSGRFATARHEIGVDQDARGYLRLSP